LMFITKQPQVLLISFSSSQTLRQETYRRGLN
jgi:hypothetical protein